MEKLIFLPEPDSVCCREQTFEGTKGLCAVLTPELYSLPGALSEIWPELVFRPEGSIFFKRDTTLLEEAYRLEIDEDWITVGYGDCAGAFYGAVTLRQIVLQCGGALPCCTVSDAPGLKTRGVLLDISRGKVPRLQTLKKLADLLASFKINHLELYIEGFSFGYPAFPGVWEKGSCLMPEEIKELSDYCRARFIALVPHQNSLGHMAPWLAKKEYRHLAEAQDGLQVMGMRFPPTTLDAADSGSLDLVKALMADLLSALPAGRFHVGLDEPFELGKGKNREFVQINGINALVLPYIESLYDFLKERGIQMMMWDDLPGKHPELTAALPEDILLLNWGYDAEYPVERRAESLKASGHRFWVCPGTSSWSSFTGLTENMLENIARAGRAAYAYGADGLMVTDWGDMNHLQYLPVSYPGLAYAAAWAWNAKGITRERLADALDLFVYRDASGRMARLALDAGRFYLEEEFRLPCRSLACLPLLFGRITGGEYEKRTESLAKSVTFFSPEEVCRAYLDSYEKRKPFAPEKLYGFLEDRLAELDRIPLPGKEGSLMKREYRNALKTLFYLTGAREEIITNGRRAGQNALRDEILEEHRILWTERNKEGGLEAGAELFGKL